MANRKLVYAHRGLSAEHAENTMAAFRAAVEAGFNGIELDVRATHDGHVVCLHDAGIDRTTDGNGLVGDYTLDELSEFETAEGPIPTLAEVADLPIPLNVELKSMDAAKHAVAVLRGRADTLVSAINPSYLTHFQTHVPEIPRALITLGPPDVEDLDAAAELGCVAINVDHDFLTPEVAEMIRERGFEIGAWTVNDELDALSLDADH
ncbi:MAG: glycerophosphodiester phosphodiesterase, partial [Thermoplasmatota archaeon]